MNKTYKILGKRGRITIPFEIRQKLGFVYNDVISFEETGKNTVIVKREKICDNCHAIEKEPVNKPTDEVTLLDFLDGLSAEEQRAALVHLSVKWATLEGRKKNG